MQRKTHAAAEGCGLRLQSGRVRFNVRANSGIFDRYTVSQRSRSGHHESERFKAKSFDFVHTEPLYSKRRADGVAVDRLS